MSVDLEVFKTILLKNKEEILTYLKEAKSNNLDETNAPDEVDVATNISSASLTKRLIERQSLYLKRLDIALNKIEDGTYGECEECGELISEKRLLARPVAVMCIICKERHEKLEKLERLPRGFTSEDAS